MLLNSFRRETLDDYPARSEGKIKSYGSCTDVSAWSNKQSRRSTVLLSWIKRKSRTKPYIPLDKLLDLILNINNHANKKTSKCPPSCNSNVVVEEINQALTKLQNTFSRNHVIFEYFERAQIDYESHNLKKIIMQKIDVLCQIITENVSDSLERNCDSELSPGETQSDDSFSRDSLMLMKTLPIQMDSGVQFSCNMIRKNNNTQYENPNLKALPTSRNDANASRLTRIIDTKNSEVSCNLTENIKRDFMSLHKLYQSELMKSSRLEDENGRLKRNIKDEKNSSEHSNLQTKAITKTYNTRASQILSTKTKSETGITMEVFENEISENITRIEITHKTAVPLLRNTSVNNNEYVQDPLDVLFQVTKVFQTIMKKEYSKIHNAEYNDSDHTHIYARELKFGRPESNP